MMSLNFSSNPVKPGRRDTQTGFALITVLLMLVMLTLLAISMYRGFGLQEKVAGNTREKERALQGGQNALAFGEWLLLNGKPATGVSCAGTNTAVTGIADMRVCAVPLTNPGDPDNWASYSPYNPAGMRVAAGGGLAPAGNPLTGKQDINYSQTPKLNLSYLGLSPDGKQALYSVTAAGFGGTSGTRAVVQSVYAISATITSLDQP